MSQPEASTSTSYVINGRYLNAKTRAPLTLRYVGQLPGTDLTWLGVEYDDPIRGKHSGEYKGETIFHCSQAGAGAFIKYPRGSSPLIRGTTCVEAVQERYGTLDNTKEEDQAAELKAVTLGSSNGIVVEAPGMAEVRRRIGRLERLREIGFDGEWVASMGGSDDERRLFKERLRGVKTLDLSRNLLASWRDVAEVVGHLQGLSILILNYSKLGSAEELSEADRASARETFSLVTELHLGNCNLSWPEALRIAQLFPSLQTLYLNGNPITAMAIDSHLNPALALPRLNLLSLDECNLHSWEDVASALLALPALDTLHLSDNPIASIPAPRGATFTALTTLALRNTQVTAWSDIDHLSTWAKLENLRISCAVTPATPTDNLPDPDPFSMTGDAHTDRSLLIATFASLTSLNGTAVSRAERWDAELHYLTVAGGHNPQKWGRYDDLVRLHGAAKQPKPRDSTLQSKMINIDVIPPSGLTFTLRLLRSAPVSMLHKRVSKHMGTQARAWTARPHPEAPEALGAWEPVEEMEGGELDRWVSDGDKVVAVVV